MIGRAPRGAGARAPTSLVVPAAAAGRGIGPLDMARALRTGGAHRASGRLALHILDALLATEESMARGGFVEVRSDFEPTLPVPADWNPLEYTLG